MKQLKKLAGEQGYYPMGLTVTKNRLHASIVSAGETCSLVLFEKGKDEPEAVFAMDPAERQGNVWNLTLAVDGKLPKNLEYCFEIDGRMKADPYGKVMTGWEEWGQIENAEKTLRSPLTQADFDWGQDARPGISPEDRVIYRVHTRGLTCHRTSGVREKGTFKGIIGKIPYMKELGVTTVELMPVSEFQEVMVLDSQGPFARSVVTGRINYWGYAGGYGFAPKASYASGKSKDPAREFKMLVKELHQAGMELVLELFFTGKESPVQAIDMVRYWVREYHLDGIHLVGYAPVQLIGQDPYLADVTLYASDWQGIKGKNLVCYRDDFQNDMRRFLKGDEEQLRGALYRITDNPAEMKIVNYMANTNGFTLMDSVSYDRKHNEANGENNRDGSDRNFSWNCGEEGPTRKRKVLELRKKQIRNAILFLFLSQGTPLLMAGDEFGNSQSGNNNAYCQDNDISWLNWNNLRSNRDIYEFVKQAAAFRREHPVFRMKQAPRMMDYLSCGYPDVSFHGVNAWYPEYENFRRQAAIMYCGHYGKKDDGKDDDFFFVIYNMHWESYQFALPNLPKDRRWYVAADTDQKAVNGFYQAGEEPLLEDQRQYAVAGRTVAVLIGKKEEKESEKPALKEGAGKKRAGAGKAVKPKNGKKAEEESDGHETV